MSLPLNRVVALALLFRLAVVIYLFHLHGISPHWENNEAAAIAGTLIKDRAYGPAFQGATGPTAWIAPVYPFILAGIFAICGIETRVSFAVAVILNCALAALTVVPIYKIAETVFSDSNLGDSKPGDSNLGMQAGKTAAILFAVCPYEALIPYIVWETTLSGLVLTYAVLLTLRAETGQRSSWLKCGVMWGIEGLISPAMLAPFPFLMLHLWRRTLRWQSAAIMAAGMLAVISPWVLRNQIVLHEPVLRSNAWAEIYFGNIDYSEYPGNPRSEYRALGERDFSRTMRQRVLQYVAGHPARFASDTVKRALTFWHMPGNFFPLPDLAAILCAAGVVLAARRGYAILACILILLCCPLIYYICYSFSRYRYPVEPIMWIFVGYFLVNAYERFVARA